MGLEVISQGKLAGAQSGSETRPGEPRGDARHPALRQRHGTQPGETKAGARGCAAPRALGIQIRPVPVRLCTEHACLPAANRDRSCWGREQPVVPVPAGWEQGAASSSHSPLR